MKHTKKKLKLIADDGLHGIDAIKEDNEESDDHLFTPTSSIMEKRKKSELLTIDYNGDADI